MQLNAQPHDTSIEALRVQVQTMRRLGMEGRARLVFDLSQSLREMLAAGVRHRHPDYAEQQVRQAVVRLVLGDELFRLAGGNDEVEP